MKPPCNGRRVSFDWLLLDIIMETAVHTVSQRIPLDRSKPQVPFRMALAKADICKSPDTRKSSLDISSEVWTFSGHFFPRCSPRIRRSWRPSSTLMDNFRAHTGTIESVANHQIAANAPSALQPQRMTWGVVVLLKCVVKWDLAGTGLDKVFCDCICKHGWE